MKYRAALGAERRTRRRSTARGSTVQVALLVEYHAASGDGTVVRSTLEAVKHFFFPLGGGGRGDSENQREDRRDSAMFAIAIHGSESKSKRIASVAGGGGQQLRRSPR